MTNETILAFKWLDETVKNILVEQLELLLSVKCVDHKPDAVVIFTQKRGDKDMKRDVRLIIHSVSALCSDISPYAVVINADEIAKHYDATGWLRKQT